MRRNRNRKRTLQVQQAFCASAGKTRVTEVWCGWRRRKLHPNSAESVRQVIFTVNEKRLSFSTQKVRLIFFVNERFLTRICKAGCNVYALLNVSSEQR